MSPHKHARRGSRLIDIILLAMVLAIVVEQFHPFLAEFAKSAVQLARRMYV